MRYLFALFLGLALTVPAMGDDALAQSAHETLKKAVGYMRSISAGGGYLWRYSLDLKTRAGEGEATDTMIWIQPPGTPSMGDLFVDAFTASGDSYFRAAARDVAKALTYGQLESGGWHYSVDFDPERAKRYYRRGDVGTLSGAELSKRKNTSTYDDNNTQSALRFLMRYVVIAPGDRVARETLDYGLQKLVEAQYPNGAWPQRYRGEKADPNDYPILKASIPEVYSRLYEKQYYSDHYTLNDDALRDLIWTMLEAWKQFGNREYLDAVRKGGEFLLMAQLPEPQPVWAQQYNSRMEPAWARAFEPPAACGGESVGAMRMLMDLHIEFGDAKYLEPISRALKWYERSKVADNTWNRYYELGSNRPIFGDRDGKIHYSLEELSEERQNGYTWSGPFFFPSVKEAYEELMELGREAVLQSRKPKELSDRNKRRRISRLEPRVKKVIAGLDRQGRWVTKGGLRQRDYEFGDRVETVRFIENAKLLSGYLRLTKHR